MKVHVKERELTDREKSWARRQISFHAASSGKVQITSEEMARWTPMLHHTAQTVLQDAGGMVSSGRGRIAEIIELTLDANRMTSFNDEMTFEEEGVLCGLWIKKDRVTMAWLRKELNY